ncbi:PAS domain-containing sensor histidine kinase [Bacillus canaveralius]|uniref:histidine kinase n=1 Tax=Bacillus canaveralius TaxID=1403243 RepID=A0A2N5GJT3_9BACI|nr:MULTISPECIES: ATP-binding protein [Bacillus]PLR81490.1 PAS domain-containing sensor histidine kinase [Bacillus canaveralius]PLR82349.1 PAS domain-containing sensor histidine kinase [Bacillus sp. V33-4]PLR93874.1 PAS domain-containing sensor histidine kinase [Bacillus canaveralius]RSK49165.1 HAMP domain-containing histidine kinase [Bacillus canaveralius]
MTRFRTRLLFALITLIMAVLLGLGLLLGQLFKNYYLNSFNERLEKESKLVSMYIEDIGGIAAINQERFLSIADMLDARVTFADLQGDILFDSGELNDAKVIRHDEIIRQIVEDSADEEAGYELGREYDVHYYWKPIMQDGEKMGYLFLSTKMGELKNAYTQIWWLLIVSLGISLFVIILLGTRITTRYTKPVEAATNVAIELAKGNYRARTYEDHIDETGMLSASINVLARNLQDMMKAQEMQQDRLTTLIENMGSGMVLIDSRGYVNMINRTYKEIFNVDPSKYLYQLYYEVIEHKEISKLVEEIFMTEQRVKKQMLIPLSIERRHFEVYGAPIIGTNDVWKGILLVFHDITELKKLEQMRKDFVANVSHELKTPITSIKGFSETLLDGAMNERDTLEAFLNIILKESDRLQSLIQDLLDLSKTEKEGFVLNVQPLDLISTLHEVFAILEGEAKEKNIDLHLEADQGELEIEGDQYRLKQVFINVINNSITYTPEGGTVTVSVKEAEETVTVQIKDTGIGIKKEEIPRIFERFYRVDKARSRNSGGTGLGLAIVKHLIEAHKGSIFVRSNVGKGTEFTIELLKSLNK